MVELTLQPGDAVAERIHRPFRAVELTLQHHQAQRVAGQFCIQPLAVAGIEHAEQGFETEAKIRFTATEHTERRAGVKVNNAVERNVQRVSIAMTLMRQLLHQTG
ncbi:hypothetical protein D3C72_864580 [compost metagenome]